LAALESALASAYKKDAPSPEQDIVVKMDTDTGNIKAYVRKVVASTVTDPNNEIPLDEAQNLRDTAQIGETIEVEFTPKIARRITAQTARQIILQRLREAEYHVVYEEFVDREGEVVSGIIQFIEPRQIYVKLNRTEAILPLSEQARNERYYRGQRLRFYLLEVARGIKGAQVILSRTHPNLLRRLFELEIPEVHNGVVEVKAVAREAGYRSKLAVSTRQEGVDPVGCCLGPRGIRIQSIINDLNGEKIDVIQWHADPEVFISNALSPAQVASVKIDEAEKIATVVVPDKQLSLAIGKEGQNARLAARLTGWRIDIKSISAAEAERAVSQELEREAEESASTEPAVLELASAIGPEEPTELLPVTEAPPEKPEDFSTIRFAEDILPSTPDKKIPDKEKREKVEKAKLKSKTHKKQVFYPEEDTYEE